MCLDLSQSKQGHWLTENMLRYAFNKSESASAFTFILTRKLLAISETPIGTGARCSIECSSVTPPQTLAYKFSCDWPLSWEQ